MRHLTPDQRLLIEDMHRVTSDQLQALETALAFLVAAVIQNAYDAVALALKVGGLALDEIVGLLRQIIAATEADLAATTAPFVAEMFHVALERAAVSAVVMTGAHTDALIEAVAGMDGVDRAAIVTEVTAEMVGTLKATALHPVAGFPPGVIPIQAAVIAAKLDPEFSDLAVLSQIAPGQRALVLSRAVATRTDNVVSVGLSDRIGVHEFVNIGVPDHVQCNTCWLASAQDAPLSLDEWQGQVLDGRFRPTPWKTFKKVSFVRAQIVHTPQRHRHCRCRLSAYDLSDERSIKTTSDRYDQIEAFLKSQYQGAQ